MQSQLLHPTGQGVLSSNVKYASSTRYYRACQCRAFMRADFFPTTKKHNLARDVAVELANTSFSSRKLNATVQIGAPIDIVWNALTDYDNLGTFIPSLVENKCLERRPQGCILYQVGAQDVAMGVKFSAACTLEIQEHRNGIADGLCTVDGNFDYYFPCPGTRSSISSGGGSRSSNGSSSDSEGAQYDLRDISFSLVEGDFQAFKGIWRMQRLVGNDSATVLDYSLFVKPHPWLPVGLIQSRIKSEVVNNLKAVRRHAEHVHKQQQRGQRTPTSSSLSTAETTSNNSVGTDTE